MKWFEYLPNHWQRRVRDHLASSQSKYGELSAADFTHDLRLKFEDGSDAFFRYAFYLPDELESEVVVFTDHCGYHVFPFCISSLETIDKEGNVLRSESFLID